MHKSRIFLHLSAFYLLYPKTKEELLMFFDNLTKICEEQNIKLTPLLMKLNLSTGNINKWRNGTLPNGEILIKLADSLGCSTDYLLGRTEKNENIETKENQIELLENFERLNERGKEEALKRIHELTFIDSYVSTFKEHKTRPTMIADYGGDGVMVERTTKEEDEKTLEIMRKIKFRKQ